MLRPTRGFTLIELLIVIAIILILIAIALPNFLEAQLRAKITRLKADLRTIGIAMDTYFIDFKTFPRDHDPDELGTKGLWQLTTPLKYLLELPMDPFNRSDGGLSPGEADFEMASTGVTPGAFAFGIRPKDNVHAYNVYSHGPDKGDDFNDNDGWPFGPRMPCPGSMGWLNYSPTNGTLSSGEVVQYGGEWKSGSYCIDHWQVIRGRGAV